MNDVVEVRTKVPDTATILVDEPNISVIEVISGHTVTVEQVEGGNINVEVEPPWDME